jgi:hypothetical protein
MGIGHPVGYRHLRAGGANQFLWQMDYISFPVLTEGSKSGKIEKQKTVRHDIDPGQ